MANLKANGTSAIAGQNMQHAVSLQKKSFWVTVWQYKYLYLLFLPLFLFFAVFCYAPMGGVLLAFKDYSFRAGVFGSPWTDNFGMKHFITLAGHPDFLKALKNTIIISFGRLIFEFPMPIILALLINEIRGRKFKRVVQTIYTFPHFLSWVIMYGLLMNFFTTDGILNQFLALFGLPGANVLTDSGFYKWFLFLTNNWKEAGYGTIIYLAAITSISPELYESAKIDGANRWHLVKHITWPCIKPTAAIMLVLAVAGMMNAGFDQIFNTTNPAT